METKTISLITMVEPVSVMASAKVLEAEYGEDINGAIKFAETFLLPYPPAPSKPANPRRHLSEFTSTELLEYAKEMERYEASLTEYKAVEKEYNARKTLINSIIEEYIREVSGLNSIPEQYQDKVYSRAYSDGHAYGFSEIYNILLGLVEIFN